MLLKSDINGRSSSGDEIIDVSKYLLILQRNKGWILACCLLFMFAAIALSMTMTPLYRATAVMLIEAEQNRAVSIEEVYSGIDSSKKEYYQTQFEILKSTAIATKVIDRYQLTERPEFRPNNPVRSWINSVKSEIKSLPILDDLFPPKQQPSAEQVAEASYRNVLNLFKSRLSIDPIPQTQLVKISFESEDPKLAALLANAVGEAYVESNLDARLQMTTQASTWLGSRLTELEQAVQLSQQKLTAFLEREGLVDMAGIDKLASSQLEELNSQLAEVRERRRQAESVNSLISQGKSLDETSLSTIQAISQHPQLLDARRAETEASRKVSELSQRYGPKHDRMIEATAEAAAMTQRTRDVLNSLALGLTKDLATVRQQEQQLAADLEQKKLEFRHLAVKQAEFDALKRDLNSNKELHRLFLTRQKETSATSDFRAVNARFSDRALTPLHPSKPQRTKIVALAMVLGAMLGVVLVLLRETISSVMNKLADVEDKLGLNPIGAVPKVRNALYRKKPIDHLVFFEPNERSFAEAIRGVRTSLSLHNNRKIVAVSSAVAAEGKSTVAMNLAISMASTEKVLLIDGDLRAASLGERFGLSRARAGLTNALLNGTPLEECIHRDKQAGLDVLPCGLKPVNPQELLVSDKFSDLIEQFAKRYDRIVIDTPPLLMVKDGLVIGKLAGGVVAVVKAGATNARQVTALTNLLFKHDIAMDGVVLNQVDKKYTKHYSYYADESVLVTA
ncbi:chain-length determining protein [Neiella marina]|uniref:non-specific protein-tyrosine kinase n=1 Tax=Neiella marina TaxID=508461 RepID=A0A8J2U1V0_9GAMM|nr:polysaccharide biosynthesis tyrosine autokinase [Neiella marina]GGA64570.1 chain-length determining protein [Neiella marina]